MELSLEEESTLKTKETEQFQFIRSEIVLFDTEQVISKPEELAEVLPSLSLGSIYFHFIDSRKESKDVASWLSLFGNKYEKLTEQISKLDPYFFTLPEFRKRLSQISKDFLKGANN